MAVVMRSAMVRFVMRSALVRFVMRTALVRFVMRTAVVRFVMRTANTHFTTLPSVVTIFVEKILDERTGFPFVREPETLLVQRADELSSVVHAHTALELLAPTLAMSKGFPSNLCNLGLCIHLLAHVSHLKVAAIFGLAGSMFAMMLLGMVMKLAVMPGMMLECKRAGVHGSVRLISFTSEAAACHTT